MFSTLAVVHLSVRYSRHITPDISRASHELPAQPSFIRPGREVTIALPEYLLAESSALCMAMSGSGRDCVEAFFTWGRAHDLSELACR